MMKTHHGAQGQRGIATLVILLLVGLAISAAVFGTLRYLKGSQSQTTAFHGQTQAQMLAWTGVELIYQFLSKQDSEGLDDLIEKLKEGSSGVVELATMGENPEIELFLKEVIDPTTGVVDTTTVNIHALITATAAKDTRADSRSIIEAVYQLVEDDSGGDCFPACDETPSVITFNRNLRLSGSINVSTTTGEPYSINVNGTLETGGNSITGVDVINATDSISIGSGSSFNTLNSNGDIKLTGSVSGDGHLNARGNICLTGGTSADGSVKANGFVYGSGGASFGDIQAIGVSSYSGSSPQCNSYLLLDSHGNPFAVNMSGNNAVRSVRSKASVRFNSGTVSAKPGVWAEGDLRDTNWGGSQQGTIGGTIENHGNNPQVPADINVVPGYKVSITPVGVVEIPADVFDAVPLKSSANYAFTIDSSGFKRVAVKSVSGIPDGQYYIGDYSDAYKDRLCTALTSNSAPPSGGSDKKATCAQPSNGEDSYPLCVGYSAYNGCLTYTPNNSTWAVNGVSMAPGVAWFEGNLNAGNGTYYNTFIATGNIATSGSHKNVAPNFAGPDGHNYKGDVLKGVCSNAVLPHYPEQICDAFESGEPLALTNYAYMAGSVDGESYRGGSITLGSSTKAFGSVLAGNEFNSGGSTFVYGFVTALAGGVQTNNTMGGSTTIVIDALPPNYTPVNGISIGSGGGSGGGQSESWRIAGDKVLWTRYR